MAGRKQLRGYRVDASEGRVVFVTGAARRVGAAIVRHAHACGARVVLHYGRSAADAGALAAELNARRADSAACVQADLLDLEALPAVVHAACEQFGRLDALINNASSFFATPIGEITPQAWEDLVGTNFRAPLFLAQAAAPFLARAGGCIVNITDVHAERPLPGYPLYSAAKGALLTLTRALAIELAPDVRVNAVAPGPILWPEDAEFRAPERNEIIEHTLLKRVGSPDDIARAVQFMVDSPYITGQVINVDGGRTAHL